MKTLRIAQVAPLFESVPPKGYGGTERVVSYLTEKLVELGHDVTLFATADSITSADLVGCVDHGLRTESARSGWMAWHTMMLERVFGRADDFDVIHFHTDILHYPLARRAATPCVTTMHGRLDIPYLRPFHRQFPEHPIVSISDDQRRPLPEGNFVATVHNGIPTALYDFNPAPQDYFVFLGRISPEKRVDRAIEIAIACNRRLVIAAKVDDMDRSYFNREIAHLLEHPLVRFVGEVGDDAKNALLGNACGMLFPIDWPEPFGMVVIEALACGTPVVAYGMGSVPELIDDGKTGFIVDDMRGAIAAAKRIDSIDRAHCRAVFEKRFSAASMAHRYLAVYEGLIGRTRQVDNELEAA